jgi:hypothetical protein
MGDLRMRKLVFASLLVSVIVVLAFYPLSYAYISDDEDYDVGQTESWTYAYISAYFPPRYYNFHHYSTFDYAEGYWGPAPYKNDYPNEGQNATTGGTIIMIFVYQDGNYIENVTSAAYVPPPD